MKKHAISTATAALLGLALVGWLQPETNGGAGLVFAVCLLVCNAVAAAIRNKPKGRRRPAATK